MARRTKWLISVAQIDVLYMEWARTRLERAEDLRCPGHTQSQRCARYVESRYSEE